LQQKDEPAAPTFLQDRPPAVWYVGAQEEDMEPQLPPPVVLYQLATGHYLSQAIYVAAKLGIADLLANGPERHDALAQATGTHAPSLRRVLRLLASGGVLSETEDGRFALPPLGACLQSGPGSFRAVAQLFGGPVVWSSWGDLLRTVQTGEVALHRVFGTDSFEYFAQHPDEGAVFDEAMGAFTAMVAVAVAAAYDFSAFRTVIDVGGGDGTLLTGILKENPALRGVVYDLPRVADTARKKITGAGMSDRCEFVAGDFFETVPRGGDAYLLKHVIHDWEDRRAGSILRNCRRAMDRQGKLLIVEGVYPPRIDQSLESRGAAANDVNMMVCTGGRQRSEDEFRQLFASAGFTFTRIVPTMGMSSVVEGVPA
jgi:ubiquinone/menaquinone biosynthesis C-methylase UbiE